jgi:hypothetical protein
VHVGYSCSYAARHDPYDESLTTSVACKAFLVGLLNPGRALYHFDYSCRSFFDAKAKVLQHFQASHAVLHSAGNWTALLHAALSGFDTSLYGLGLIAALMCIYVMAVVRLAPFHMFE